MDLVPRRDVRVVRGPLTRVLDQPPSDDYVHVELEDPGPVLDAMSRIRTVFPHALSIERLALRQALAQARGDRPRVDHTRLDDGELFAQFVKQTNDTDLSPEQARHFAAVAQRIRDEHSLTAEGPA